MEVGLSQDHVQGSYRRPQELDFICQPSVGECFGDLVPLDAVKLCWTERVFKDHGQESTRGNASSSTCKSLFADAQLDLNINF